MSIDRTSNVQTAAIILMIFCLVFEGLVIAFSGFPFPGKPIEVYVVGIVWLGLCISTFYYPKKPQFALIAGWVMLVVTSVSTYKSPSVSHSAWGYLYRHCVEILFIAASHLGFVEFLRHRTLSGR